MEPKLNELYKIIHGSIEQSQKWQNIGQPESAIASALQAVALAIVLHAQIAKESNR